MNPFEKFSDKYDAWFEKNKDIYKAELDLISQLLPSSSKSILEVGVGTGRFASPLGIEYGVEPSEQMAVLSKQRNIKVIRATAESLPFRDNSFDCILMVTAICFFDNILKAFKEAFRVLTPTGNIIVGFIDLNSEIGQQYNKRKSSSVFYKDATFLTVIEVREYLEKAGFNSFAFKQTICRNDLNIYDGTRQGAFIGIQGKKTIRR